MRKGILFFLVTVFSLCAFNAWGSEVEKQTTPDMYIDLVTMHRYVKNNDGNYSEYNRRGEFFKTVPADLPLLTSKNHVIPIKNDCYLLYVKQNMLKNYRKKALKRLSESHPEGWFLEKVLVDARHTIP